MWKDPTSEDRAQYDRLAVEYARAVDRRDYEALTHILVRDAVLAVHQGDPAKVEAPHELRGRDSILRAMVGIERYTQTMHLVANQWMRVRDDAARGETYCVAHHIYEKDAITRDYTMYIRYQDRLRRESNRWLFSERRLWVGFTTDRPLVAEGS